MFFTCIHTNLCSVLCIYLFFIIYVYIYCLWLKPYTKLYGSIVHAVVFIFFIAFHTCCFDFCTLHFMPSQSHASLLYLPFKFLIIIIKKHLFNTYCRPPLRRFKIHSVNKFWLKSNRIIISSKQWHSVQTALRRASSADLMREWLQQQNLGGGGDCVAVFCR